MRVLETAGLEALCEAPRATNGERRRVSLALIGAVEVGDHLLVYLDSAVRRLEASEATQITDALAAVANAAAGEPFEHLIQDLVDREPELPPHLQAARRSSDYGA